MDLSGSLDSSKRPREGIDVRHSLIAIISLACFKIAPALKLRGCESSWYLLGRARCKESISTRI